MNTKEGSSIEIKDVVKRFGAVTALDRVSLTIRPGELFFLLGPSGCGKTTLLRILAGLETADSGVVKFDGADIADLPPHRRGAPMVFQNYALWPHLNVADNVAFGLVEQRVSRSEIKTRVEQALRRVALEGLESRMPGQLSGGQQQRVVLARALVLNPRIVLLDEPLSNLDAKLRLEMREHIESLHAGTGITFVYVTHDQAEALSLADRMAVMNNGTIEAVGSPSELYHAPANRFCALFLGDANLLPGTILSVEKSSARINTTLGEWNVTVPSGLSPSAGKAVECMIRPEYISPAPKDCRINVFNATVESSRIQGNTVSLSVRTATGTFKVTVLNRPGVNFSVGSSHSWTVDPSQAVLIQEAT